MHMHRIVFSFYHWEACSDLLAFEFCFIALFLASVFVFCLVFSERVFVFMAVFMSLLWHRFGF